MSDVTREEDVPEGAVLPADADSREAHRVVPHDEDSVPPPAAPVGSLPVEEIDTKDDLGEDDDEEDDDEVDDDDAAG